MQRRDFLQLLGLTGAAFTLDLPSALGGDLPTLDDYTEAISANAETEFRRRETSGKTAFGKHDFNPITLSQWRELLGLYQKTNAWKLVEAKVLELRSVWFRPLHTFTPPKHVVLLKFYPAGYKLGMNPMAEENDAVAQWAPCVLGAPRMERWLPGSNVACMESEASALGPSIQTWAKNAYTRERWWTTSFLLTRETFGTFGPGSALQDLKAAPERVYGRLMARRLP